MTRQVTAVASICSRCGGTIVPAEHDDRACLMCGEYFYERDSIFIDRLLDAMERQAIKETRRVD